MGCVGVGCGGVHLGVNVGGVGVGVCMHIFTCVRASLCESQFVCTTVCTWESENKLGCRSLLPTLFETLSLLFPTVYSMLTSLETSMDFPISASHLTIKVAGLQIISTTEDSYHTWLYVHSEDLNLGPQVYVVGALPLNHFRSPQHQRSLPWQVWLPPNISS